MAQKLGLKGGPTTGRFTLAGGSVIQLKTEEIKFYLSSAAPTWKREVFEIIAYIIDRPSSELNCVEVDLSEMSQGLHLADNYPHEPTEVDIMCFNATCFNKTPKVDCIERRVI